MTDSAEFRIRPLAPGDIDEVVALAAEEFGAQESTPGELRGLIDQWQFAKSPVVVARTADGAFAGYARAEPFEVETSPRPEGQVLVLRELAVVPGQRARGAGGALLARIRKTGRMLGYARAVASLPEAAAGWFAAHDWEVLSAGRGRAWIEPHIARDDLWLPGERSGVFSPVLTVPAEPGHPLEAWAALAEGAPIVEIVYDSLAGLDAVLIAALRADPAATAALPPRTRELLGL